MNKVEVDGCILQFPDELKVQLKCEEDASMLAFWLNHSETLLKEFNKTMWDMLREAMKDV
jgi:hypothetical protein